jgi:Ricin-type beta-trefoil lectin domain/Putative Ig domain
MFKRFVVAGAAACLSLAGAVSTAQAQSRPHPADQLPGVHVVSLHRAYEARLGHTKPGKISGILYPVGRKHGAAARSVASCTEPNCPVSYHGGSVQHTPHVYLLLWGPNWTSDPGQEASAAYLENFFSGLGVQPKDIWSPLTSQYGDGSGSPTFTRSVFNGAFLDTSTPPHGVDQSQLAAEADTFASNQGITDLTDAQIVVATQSGTCPQGFDAPCNGTNGTYCAWHSSSSEPYINLPYVLDAGTACGEDFVNAGGTDDGWSIVAGHEYAETITDPFPPTGWIDDADSVSGGEIADKCAWGGELWGSHDPATDIALSTGSFAMQSLWSNAAGRCAMSDAAPDTVSLTNPGSQSTTIGGNVSLQLSGSSSGGYLLTWHATGLPAGLSLDSHTGVISGTASTAQSKSVTVSAEDETGAANSASFSWTVSGSAGAVTGDHGECLDDYGSGTTEGNKVDIWSCNGTVAQKWTFSNGALSVVGMCLDDVTQGGPDSKLVIWRCNGNKAQTWSHRSNGEYVLKLNGLCLTDPSASSVNGTQVQIRSCSDNKDQKWSLP